MKFLNGETRLLMRKQEEKIEKKSLVSKHRKTEIANEELFDILRSLRTQLSSEEGVPPYVVFSDKTLAAMTEMLPINEEEFLEIPGVGEKKLEKYGDLFIRVIKAWKEDHTVN